MSDKELLEPTREFWLGHFKRLIEIYNIKQEELYPWIACSDRMPEDDGFVDYTKPVIIGHVNSNGVIVPDYSSTYYRGYEDEPEDFFWVCYFTEEVDPTLVINPPTHWHPIPTLD